MRRFGEPAHIQLIGLFTRAQRRTLFPERADWRFLLGAAWNLAFMTARMHHDNLVIGDFSSSNVVVDANGFVTFLDCDSIAFTDPATGELFPCLMHTTDYSPPSARRAARPAAIDDFALVVLVHLLLTAGNHRAFGLSGIEPDQPHAPNGLERTRPGGGDTHPARGPFPCPRSHGDVIPAAPEHRKPRSRRSHDRAIPSAWACTASILTSYPWCTRADACARC